MADIPNRTLLEQLRQWITHPIQSLTQQRHQPEAYRQWLTINTEGPVQMEKRQGVARGEREPSNLVLPETQRHTLRHEHYAQQEREQDAANESARERVRERQRERGREMER